MSTFAYETMYLGLLWIFRATDDEGYLVGPVFVELATSRDGIHWEREDGDRPPILPLGKPGSWEDGMIYTANHPLVEGDRIKLYYGGFDEEHSMPMHGKIGLATLRKDGFASLDAGDKEGTILTKRLAGVSGPLHVNCTSSAGWVKVELLDGDGKVIPGFGRYDCTVLQGDSVDQVVAWGEKKELPAGIPAVRVRFLLKNAAVYSFMAGESARVLDEPAGPVLAGLYTFEDDWGRKATDKLTEDGAQGVDFTGYAKVDDDPREAAFGKHSMDLGSEFTPMSAMEIRGTTRLGRQFTLAAQVKLKSTGQFRIFSSYGGCGPIRSNEIVFDADPSGKALPGLRLVSKGISTASKPVHFEDGKYHHFAAVYDDGAIALYFDGAEVGRGRVPGGEPVEMTRNLFVGGDTALDVLDQFTGNVDDVLVIGKALSAKDVEAIARDGAEAFFRNVHIEARGALICPWIAGPATTTGRNRTRGVAREIHLVSRQRQLWMAASSRRVRL